MPLWEILVIILGSGATAASVTGLLQIMLWKLNRRAAVEDRADGSHKHMECALKAILHDRIKWLGKAHITQGDISTEDLRDLIDMHVCYHELKGNGLLDNVMKQVKMLPIRK